MSINNFKPELWSDSLLMNFRKSLVFGDVVNRDYQGTIGGVGSSVVINGIGPITVNSYAGTVTYESLQPDSQKLVITEDKYFAFLVDDLDRLQSNVGLVEGASAEAAYSLADNIDQYIAGLHAQAGAITTSTAVNSANAFEALLTLSEKLDEFNAPTQGRWVVIPSWFKTKLVLAKHLVENTTNDALDNGVVGRVCGFDVRQSNNVNNDGTNWKIMAGVTPAISMVAQMDGTLEALRGTAAFGDYVRGRLVYGAKVVRPQGLVVLDATIAAEA